MNLIICDLCDFIVVIKKNHVTLQKTSEIYNKMSVPLATKLVREYSQNHLLNLFLLVQLLIIIYTNRKSMYCVRIIL